MALLEVKNLTVEFSTSRGPLQAVQNLNFSIEPGEALGIVGESGSGKSVTSLAIMDLLPSQGRVVSGEITFSGAKSGERINLLTLPEAQRQKLRGGFVSMIFQDPMSSLNPSFKVGDQIIETIRAHRGGSKSSLKPRALELLHQVGISDPETRLEAYPHQLSGGMNQRIMIAMAISCDPKILIADEPTTALDVTIQAQILNLLFHLQKKNKMSLILITHDLGVVSENTDHLMVMYAGQGVEYGSTHEILAEPEHPYTEGLLKCLPSLHVHSKKRQPLPTIGGLVPDLVHRPHGCQLHPRCIYAEPKCQEATPEMRPTVRRFVRCIKPLSKTGKDIL